MYIHTTIFKMIHAFHVYPLKHEFQCTSAYGVWEVVLSFSCGDIQVSVMISTRFKDFFA